MEIKSITDAVLFVSSLLTLKEALQEAAAKKANLSGADLYRANLSRADLRGADLSGAELPGADLSRADLSGADLRGANLSGANLRGADLRGANLRGANLRGANLYGADLRGANLYGANLRGADLRGADLRGAKGAELHIARIQHIPETGAFEGWKKCKDGIIVKLLIPEDAKRSHGTERKCRCSKAVVLEVIGSEEAHSLHDSTFIYRKGETVMPSGWNENRWETCGEGIHFYITRLEAENHS